MPSPETMVINTSPLISLVAALGELRILDVLYRQVLVPFEVGQEILQGGASGFAVSKFEQATFLQKWQMPLSSPHFLSRTLGQGEAAVIQLALNEGIQTVCIDEASGRRVARLHNLLLTGTVGILIRAKREGYPFAMDEAIERMRKRGIWLSEHVIKIALEKSRES